MNARDFKSFFADLAARHNELQGSFCFGDVAAFLQMQRSTVRYPILWVEVPEVVLNDEDSGDWAQYQFAFMVVAGGAADDLARTHENIFAAEVLINDILQYISYQAAQPGSVIRFNPNRVKIIPLSNFNIDNVAGFRCEAEWFAPYCVCRDDCNAVIATRFDLSKSAPDNEYQPPFALAPSINADIDFIIMKSAHNEITFAYSPTAGETVTWLLTEAATGAGITSSSEYTFSRFGLFPNTLYTIALTRVMNGVTQTKTVTFQPATYL